MLIFTLSGWANFFSDLPDVQEEIEEDAETTDEDLSFAKYNETENGDISNLHTQAKTIQNVPGDPCEVVQAKHSKRRWSELRSRCCSSILEMTLAKNNTMRASY